MNRLSARFEASKALSADATIDGVPDAGGGTVRSRSGGGSGCSMTSG
jgi:hypothetical protein